MKDKVAGWGEDKMASLRAACEQRGARFEVVEEDDYYLSKEWDLDD